MVVMDRRPELSVPSGTKAELRVERTEILCHDLDEGRVRIEVTVHNDGELRSAPTWMRIESAPLGAFVPWKPLTQLLVPALAPGESRQLCAEVARPHPAPLGDFNRVPPQKLLTAINSPDQPSPANNNTGLKALLELLRRGQSGSPSRAGMAAKGTLAADLWDWVGRGQSHWAGNLNVFVGPKAVERHLARALRVYPGRTNLAVFIVGSPGRRDAFAFTLAGLSPDWKAALYDMTTHRSLVADATDAPLKEQQWVESNGSLMVILAIQPPADCAEGNLEVHVTRRRGQKTARVEFNLDPSAQGTGCYSV